MFILNLCSEVNLNSSIKSIKLNIANFKCSWVLKIVVMLHIYIFNMFLNKFIRVKISVCQILINKKLRIIHQIIAKSQDVAEEDN